MTLRNSILDHQQSRRAVLAGLGGVVATTLAAPIAAPFAPPFAPTAAASSIAASVAKGSAFNINTIFCDPLNCHDGSGFMDQVTREAFRRIGMAVGFTPVPAKRSIINLNEGMDDGNLARIGGLEAQYANIVPVPEKLLDMEFMAFGKKQGNLPTIDRPEIFGDVAIIRGWKVFEPMVAEANKVMVVSEAEQLFSLLKMDRVETALFEKWQGLWLRHVLGAKGISIAEKPLDVRPVYLYVHVRHRAVVDRLADALREMKADGAYRRIYNRILAPLDRQAPT